MKLFRNKYRQRIEDKIMEIYHEKMTIVYEAGAKKHTMTTKEQIHYIVLKAEYDKQIELLKSLL